MPAWLIRFLPHILGSLAALGIAVWVYGTIWDKGYTSCKGEWNRAQAAAVLKRDAELEVARLRGDALSAGLAEKEREYGNLRSEYLAYAHAIPGVCDPALGVLVAAASTQQHTPVPQAPSAPASPPPAVSSADIAANVAENYTRAWVCIAQLNALIDWHATAAEVVAP